LSEQAGGKVEWDYSIFTVPVYAYQNTEKTRRALEVICIILLVMNVLSELAGNRVRGFIRTT
jgi:hypothetical protein